MRQLRLLSIMAVCSAILAAGAGAASALDPVQVHVTPMTFKVEVADHQGRGGGAGYYIKRDSIRMTEETVDVVTLNNGLVEAWVCPAYGARLLRAFDVKTGTDYFSRSEVFTDHLAWSVGGVKPSFPFFEHGTQLKQPAGYRVLRNADGSATVAMDLRFYQYTSKDDLQRYGRYSDEALDIFVTVTPGSNVVSWRQRKENLSPMPHSDKMWNDTQFPQERIAEKKTVTEKGKEVTKDIVDEAAMKARTSFIYPAGWVCDHGPTVVHTSPHWSGLDNWNVSHFSIAGQYGFAGGYYPLQGVSRLRIHDPKTAPGMKLYTAFWADMFELWGGIGTVFEVPGELKPAYVPAEFTHRFYITQGIGKVSYANDDVAVGVDGNAFAMVATRGAAAVVTDDTGNVVAQGPIGPHTIVKGIFNKKLTVTLDGVKVLEQTFPLDLPTPSKENVFAATGANTGSTVPEDVRNTFQALLDRRNPAKNPTYYEQEGFCANEGALTMRNVLPVAKTLGAGGDPTGALSVARGAYRLGDLANAERIAKLYPGPEADFLLGLVAWEQGKPAEFGKAGVEANYHRAMLAVQQGDVKAAIAYLDALVAVVPTAYYPRLMRAYLAKDVQGEQALAAENAASPEAQLVLELLGVAGAQAEKDALLKNNPEAAAQVAHFAEQITKGQWQPVPRFPL